VIKVQPSKWLMTPPISKISKAKCPEGMAQEVKSLLFECEALR
jgi:hypothetical protein